ncbi:MAG: NapC/NirT family cytochrome c [Elusimicrobia bacterium]|nr:NapC/NirT family cytochrome c [Elusimicrobiota bacterium]
MNRRRKLLLLLGGLGLLLALGGTGGLVKYSESPKFCSSCHIMLPYYDAWKTSKHKDVACVECHYPPGMNKHVLWKKFQNLSQVAKYVTRTYSSKPFAEIEDNSCLRSGCHSQQLLQGLVQSKTTKMPVRFDHQPHLSDLRRGRQLRCASCHSQIVVGRHVEVTYDTCFLCHFKGRGNAKELKPLGGCLSCHELPTKDFRLGDMNYNHRDFVSKQKLSCLECHAGVVQGEGKASEDRCLTCHNQPDRLAKFNDTPFLHERHVSGKNVACFHCHQEIRHGASAMNVALDQSPDKRRHEPLFDCKQCHEDKHLGQREFYTGRAKELGLAEMPSPMFEANVQCTACHYKDHVNGSAFQGHDFKASEQACVKCHGEKFKGIWEETRSELQQAVAQLGEKLDGAQAAGGDSKRLSRARQLWQLVRYGRGEHNIYLASQALRQADTLVSEAVSSSSATLADLSELPLLSGKYCATLCHERVGVKVPPQTVRAFGKTMPHGQHADMMGCVKCHEIGRHKKVPLRKDVRQTCAGCHGE